MLQTNRLIIRRWADSDAERLFTYAKAPDADSELFGQALEDIGMTKVWAGYYEGNTKSKHVLEKCGFRYQWKSEGIEVLLMHETRTGYASSISKEQWELDRNSEKLKQS